MPMPDTNYLEIVKSALEKMKNLHRERESLDIEIAKLEQFVSATANLLPESERNLIIDLMENIQEIYRLREVGLTDAIRGVLKASAGQWFTAANVRDRLISLGFDFSGYTANPLASVSTTLRRVKSDDIETTNVDGGVTAYRWKKEKSLAERVKEAQENRKIQTFRAMQEALSRKGDVVPGGLTPPDDIENALKAPFKKR